MNSVALKDIRKALGEVTVELSAFHTGTRDHPFLELAAAKRTIKTSIGTLLNCIAALDELMADDTNLRPGNNISARQVKP